MNRKKVLLLIGMVILMAAVAFGVWKAVEAMQGEHPTEPIPGETTGAVSDNTTVGTTEGEAEGTTGGGVEGTTGGEAEGTTEIPEVTGSAVQGGVVTNPGADDGDLSSDVDSTVGAEETPTETTTGKDEETKPTESTEPWELPEAKDVTYELYNAMTGDQQVQFYESFKNPADFFTWYNNAKAVYDAAHPDIEIDGNPIDAGDLAKP